MFKALADRSRRKLLDALCLNNGQSLSELCELLDMARQSVTKHLLILERAGLIAVKWGGREKLHYLNPVPIQETYGRWVSKYERHRLKALDALKAGLEGYSERHEEAKGRSSEQANVRLRQLYQDNA